MGTRSTIALQYEDGSVKQIYAHWDGYLSHNGKILYEHYTDIEKIKHLMDLGPISSLGEEIGVKHDFDDRSDQFKMMCNAYGRDRDEDFSEASHYDDLKSYVADLSLSAMQSTSQEFNYLYMHGQWMVSYCAEPAEFRILKEEIDFDEQANSDGEK